MVPTPTKKPQKSLGQLTYHHHSVRAALVYAWRGWLGA